MQRLVKPRPIENLSPKVNRTFWALKMDKFEVDSMFEWFTDSFSS